MRDQPHVAVLVECRYLLQLQPLGVARALEARGVRVTLLDPQVTACRFGDCRWLDDVDLLLTRGRSWKLLSLLGWAEACGVPTVNTRAAIAAVHNKADMSRELVAAGVPTPPTFFGRASRISDDAAFPVVLKPIFGDNGNGVREVSSREELTLLTPSEAIVMAQELVSGDGFDVKLYAIGDDLWAVRKPSPLSRGQQTNGRSRAELVPLPPAWRELGRRCGRLFGLDLYGVDCIATPSGPVVIEVNEFPNYTGVPDADGKLADYVAERARTGISEGRTPCVSAS